MTKILAAIRHMVWRNKKIPSVYVAHKMGLKWHNNDFGDASNVSRNPVGSFWVDDYGNQFICAEPINGINHLLSVLRYGLEP